MSRSKGDTYRRIKHAQGLEHLAHGNEEEARKCFAAVFNSAKTERDSEEVR